MVSWASSASATSSALAAAASSAAALAWLFRVSSALRDLSGAAPAPASARAVAVASVCSRSTVSTVPSASSTAAAARSSAAVAFAASRTASASSAGRPIACTAGQSHRSRLLWWPPMLDADSDLVPTSSRRARARSAALSGAAVPSRSTKRWTQKHGKRPPSCGERAQCSTSCAHAAEPVTGCHVAARRRQLDSSSSSQGGPIALARSSNGSSISSHIAGRGGGGTSRSLARLSGGVSPSKHHAETTLGTKRYCVRHSKCGLCERRPGRQVHSAPPV
eukprot:scaffold132263_cov60-Phaeocystis_antarctica.AAC.4